MNIKDYPIRIRKKGKTRGRPSKFEIYSSKLFSDYMKRPIVKAMFQQYVHDMLVYGRAEWPQLPKL